MSTPKPTELASGVPVGESNPDSRPEETLDRQFGVWSAVALGVMCGCAWPLFGGTIVSFFNGSGNPIDQGPKVFAEDYLDINGTSSNISATFCLNMLQALPSTRTLVFILRK